MWVSSLLNSVEGGPFALASRDKPSSLSCLWRVLAPKAMECGEWLTIAFSSHYQSVPKCDWSLWHMVAEAAAGSTDRGWRWGGRGRLTEG